MVIPNYINISYNLIKRNKYNQNFDILRELNDDPEKL